MIEADKLAQAIIEWNQAGYGHKSEVVRRHATSLGVGYDTLYRDISRAKKSTRKKRNDIGKRMNPNINEWTQTIWKVKLRPPEEAGMVATDQAIKAALKHGLITQEAANVSVSTYNRIARYLGINREEGRFARFQAKYANLVHQFDASSSKFFYIHRRLPDGDYLLKMHRPAANYKNKPVPIRLRPWVYGLVDDYSGYQLCRYTAAEGESAADAVLFLQYAWAKKEDTRIPMRGLPKLVYMDNGPLAKAAPTRDFLERLNITTIHRKPYNKRAGGKIERPWRTLWNRFELPFLTMDNWQSFEIKMSELNRQLVNYLIEQNARAHRYQKDITREQAWLSIIQRGGAVDIPQHALSTIFQRHQRTVRGGYFSLYNKDYQVAGLAEGKVWVYEGVFDDRLIVEDIKTQTKYEVELFEPLSFGERIEAVKTEAENLAEQSREEISITTAIYEEDEGTNIVNIPVKGEERELPDPLNIPTPAAQAGEQLFGSPRERYDDLHQRKCTGEGLPDYELRFMLEFEQTPLYGQLESTYKKWEQFYQKREANA